MICVPALALPSTCPKVSQRVIGICSAHRISDASVVVIGKSEELADAAVALTRAAVPLVSSSPLRVAHFRFPAAQDPGESEVLCTICLPEHKLN